MWLLLPPLAHAAPTADALQQAWRAAAPAIAKHGAIPYDLSVADAAALAAGEPVAQRVDTPAGAFATGAVWVAAAPDAPWIAIQDAADRPLGRDMVHEKLPGEAGGHRQTYMRMPLPWPVSDRQWVADFTNNDALFAATERKVWQRRWTLADPKLAPHPDPDALWLPASEGAWTLIAADGGTLCVFAIRTEMGGMIPESVSQRLAVSTVKKGLQNLVVHASDMKTHYRGAHLVVVAPDGAELPLNP